MIFCDLGALLARRNLTLTDVYRDTGISRTALTPLKKNKAKGIHFSTLETLCEYLNCSVSEILIYVPQRGDFI